MLTLQLHAVTFRRELSDYRGRVARMVPMRIPSHARGPPARYLIEIFHSSLRSRSKCRILAISACAFVLLRAACSATQIQIRNHLRQLSESEPKFSELKAISARQESVHKPRIARRLRASLGGSARRALCLLPGGFAINQSATSSSKFV